LYFSENCQERRCDSTTRTTGNVSIIYFACDKTCPAPNEPLKNCYKGYCSSCFGMEEKCDVDNPGSCCKYSVRIKGNNVKVNEQRCGGDGICPKPCVLRERYNACDPSPTTIAPCCDKTLTCQLVDPPNKYECLPSAQECPKGFDGSGKFKCENFPQVRYKYKGYQSVYCSCPSAGDGTDVKQCRNGKCVECVPYHVQKCTPGGPPCCKYPQKTTMCYQGFCEYCQPTNLNFFADCDTEKARCCDPKAKCERAGTSALHVCKL